jgi:basic amino acid/polyamine antiporter, APA family
MPTDGGPPSAARSAELPRNLTQESAPQLARQLGLWDASALVVGTVIGAGIFLVPSIMARHLPSAAAILVAWIVGGILSYFGALAYAELGAMFPATGGQYVFIREAFGKPLAFLCGWTLFLVVMPGQIAALAIGFATYLGTFEYMNAAGARLVAVGLIAIFTFVNYRGLKLGSLVQNIFTILKLLGIAMLVLAAFLRRHPSELHFAATRSDFNPSQFGLALAAALVAYDGWNTLSFVNGEILNTTRTIPRALGMGVAFCAVVYVVVTTAYMRALPVSALSASTHVGTDVAAHVLGSRGVVFLTIAILISILGSTNGNVLAAPRLYFAQAEDGLFFSRFAAVHPRFQTPSFSILVQGVWASLLALTGSYELVVTYAIFCAWVFYLLVVVGLIVLRWRHPSYPRPYRMWGYPLTPLAFAAVTVWFLAISLIGNPLPSLTGLLILLAGLPVYFLWNSYGKKKLRS